MSVFDRLDQLTSKAIDQQFSCAFSCFPMKSTPNGKSILDAARGTWEGWGILTETPSGAKIDVGARNRSNDFHSLVNGATYELSVDRKRHWDARNVQQRDVIIIGNRTFEVLSTRPDGMSRIVFGLAAQWAGRST